MRIPPCFHRRSIVLLNDYLMIATVLKPQGVHGECKLRSYAADIEMFRQWHNLYMKTTSGFQSVSVRVARIRDDFVYAFLNNSDSTDAAEAFRGTDLYVNRSQIVPTGKDTDLIADLIGCEARDKCGIVIGILSDVLQYGSVDTWVFRTSDGTLMAPALKSVFPEVDTEAKTILVERDRLEEVSVRS